MQLPNSEKNYMPTLVNVVMNGSNAKMGDAKMVEKVGVATIVVNKATWPVTAQRIYRHPEVESVRNQGRDSKGRFRSRSKGRERPTTAYKTFPKTWWWTSSRRAEHHHQHQ